jgi:NAD(P)-dependent dehydrogenase (short-subunit alcohol dehydrogenase family)
LKHAFITGGGSGIGRGLAAELVRRGWFVTITDIDADSARTAALACRANASDLQLDVRDAAAFKAVVAAAEAANGAIDLLINNAGIAISGEVQSLDVAHWDRIIDINLRGTVHGICAVYPGMQSRRRGTILNVASIAGLAPGPLGVPYAMTKHGVVGLSVSLRAEAAAYGVQVSVLCPGAVDTSILDQDNPADLPAVAWRPNNRVYLTRLTGAPIPVSTLAVRALDALERGDATIVLPAFARIAWWLNRLAPSLGRLYIAAVLARTRADP